MQWPIEPKVRNLRSTIVCAVNVLPPDYISSRRLLLSLADAGGRLMYAYKDILELAGLTTRIYTMLSTLHHLQPLPEFERDEHKIEFQRAVIGIPKRDPRLGETSLVGNAEEGFDFGDGSDSTDSAQAERPLVANLNIRIERGEHLMISGPVSPSTTCYLVVWKY